MTTTRKEIDAIRQRYSALRGALDERSRRLVVAAESLILGRGGLSVVARATGVARQTIAAGLRELSERPGLELASGTARVRRTGGGRKRSAEKDPTLLSDLEHLMGSEAASGPLRWTSQSLRMLARELNTLGHRASHQLVAVLLRDSGYTLCGSTGGRAAATQADRAEQFEYINRSATLYLQDGDPVVAIDTKATELIKPEARLVSSEFVAQEQALELWRGANEWTGKIDEDAASFAACAIRRWWHVSGRRRYQRSARLMIAADLGNAGYPRQPHSQWRNDLQIFSDEHRLSLTICHVPAGTSKWAAGAPALVMCAFHWRHDTAVAHQAVVQEIMLPSGDAFVRPGVREFELRMKRPDGHGAKEIAGQERLFSRWNYTIAPRIGAGNSR